MPSDLSGYEARNAERSRIYKSADEADTPGPAHIALARLACDKEAMIDVAGLIAMVKERDARIVELERDAKRWKWCEENIEYAHWGWDTSRIPCAPTFAAAVDAAIAHQSHNS